MQVPSPRARGGCTTSSSSRRLRRLVRPLTFAILSSIGCGREQAPEHPDPGAEPRQQASASTRQSQEELAAAPQPEPSEDSTPAPTAASGVEPRTRYGAAERIVAFGDVHGDIAATRAVLQLAGAMDAAGNWIGGSLVLVQTGDQLDRGDDEDEILALFERLSSQARAAGGAFHVLNGNHEYMNAMGDFRYVTPDGFTDFAQPDGVDLADPRLAAWPRNQRGRAAAFTPGGPYARVLGQRNTVVIVGDTVFVHGGIRPDETVDLDALNALSRSWLLGDDGRADAVIRRIMRPDGVVWTRAYSEPVVSAAACAELDQSLKALAVSRMVVGHTVQQGGITSACDEKVWRIDVGMAEHYGGSPQALELRGAQIRVLTTHQGPGSRGAG